MGFSEDCVRFVSDFLESDFRSVVCLDLDISDFDCVDDFEGFSERDELAGFEEADDDGRTVLLSWDDTDSFSDL